MSRFQNPPFRGDIHWALQSMVALSIPFSPGGARQSLMSQQQAVWSGLWLGSSQLVCV